MTWSPLPGTTREAQVIVEIVGEKNTTLYVKNQAREEVIKQIRPPRILHLATHGFFLQELDRKLWNKEELKRGLTISNVSLERGLPLGLENPLLRSGLVLAGAGQQRFKEDDEDGFLTALEVSGLSLWETDLVVLSACETGLGEIQKGEGVFGLRRAFQLAGARTVVMSLWSVPDTETSLLMGTFYRQMKNGLSKSEALQEAAQSLMRERRQKYGAAHPFYWGGICECWRTVSR